MDRQVLRPVLIDGQRAGTWRRILGRTVVIETNLFTRLDSAQAVNLESAVRRYEDFLGVPVTLAR